MFKDDKLLGYATSGGMREHVSQSIAVADPVYDPENRKWLSQICETMAAT
ncbi:MAG: hypothetical protein AAF709_16730 [Pseudomonadota bacterium]